MDDMTTNPANPYPPQRHPCTTARSRDVQHVRDLGAAVDAAHGKLHNSRGLGLVSAAHTELESAVETLAGWDDDTIDVAGVSAVARAMVRLWRRDGSLPSRGDC